MPTVVPATVSPHATYVYVHLSIVGAGEGTAVGTAVGMCVGCAVGA